MGMSLVILALLAILWVPSVAADWRVRRRTGKRQAAFLALLLPLQAVVAALMVYIADKIGLRNPAGLVLASTVLVSASGVVLVSLRYKAAEQPD